MRHRRRANHHAIANHYGAGAGVKHHARRLFTGVDLHIFQHRHERHALARRQRSVDHHVSGALRRRRAGAKGAVQRHRHAVGSFKTWALKVENHLIVLLKIGRHFALDGPSVRHAAHGRGVDGDARPAVAFGFHTADHHVPLCQGVDFTVRSAQLRQQQGATTQAFRVTDGRDGNVDTLPARVARWQRGADRHGSNVFHFWIDFGRQLNAKLAQHIGHRLAGELHLIFIARAVEADHQAVSHQLVTAHALNIDHISQSFCGCRRRPQQHQK
ncbi:hypothetical protein D3C72_1401990 [compost metagenome]